MTEATALRLIAAIERLINLEESKLLAPPPTPVIARATPTTKPQSFADLLAGLD